jgi:hypothetical protein
MWIITRVSTVISTLSKGLPAQGYTRIGGLGLVIAIVAAAVATAAIPSGNGTISACYKSTGGDLRVRDAEQGQSCKNGETELSWSQQGPAGPQGLKGDTGPAGQDGADGEPGPPGEAASSQLYFATADEGGSTGSVQVPPEDQGRIVVLSKDVPAGSYLVEASAVLFNNDDAAEFLVECRIPSASSSWAMDVGQREDQRLRHPTQMPIALTSAINHPGGPIALECRQRGSFSRLGFAAGATLLATKVDSVN